MRASPLATTGPSWQMRVLMTVGKQVMRMHADYAGFPVLAFCKKLGGKMHGDLTGSHPADGDFPVVADLVKEILLCAGNLRAHGGQGRQTASKTRCRD